MSHIKHAFEQKIIEIAIETIIPGSQLSPTAIETAKFRTIMSSIAELGVIEPLAVFPSTQHPGDYDLLDGRLRLEALKRLGRTTAPCMVSSDDEAFTFNRHVGRIAVVQEHRMIRKTLSMGASEQRIAEVLSMDVRSIKERVALLDGIAPEVATLLKDRQVAPHVFRALKKMKPFRQIEAAEMMIAANKFTANYASTILLTTRPDGLIDSAKKKKGDFNPEDLAKMEAEMERLRQDCQSVEDEVGDTMLTLVVAKSFMTRLIRNEAVHAHLKRFHGDSLASLVSTMDAISADQRISEQE
ncbi:ParB/RepB/Spo0J family partition protein [Paraburkholderia strydomiana]|uniref:ParB/RepB/Spo0J family partition protein n=1 Tax=Paraburkholderia strydomiana TaxID=1245417 RepID=UPI00285CE88E|nr:plasmid partitioning protein RepB C-terminal domain-containing protein [Paraburkholderia strydomiana]MDR7006638.1 hypothetical protein [Paraburkholderia strydomiana]